MIEVLFIDKELPCAIVIDLKYCLMKHFFTQIKKTKKKLCKKMLIILDLQYLGISYKGKNPNGMFKHFQLFLYLLMNINEIILFWSNH